MWHVLMWTEGTAKLAQTHYVNLSSAKVTWGSYLNAEPVSRVTRGDDITATGHVAGQ